MSQSAISNGKWHTFREFDSRQPATYHEVQVFLADALMHVRNRSNGGGAGGLLNDLDARYQIGLAQDCSEAERRELGLQVSDEVRV